jgi:hypothetical protein
LLAKSERISAARLSYGEVALQTVTSGRRRRRRGRRGRRCGSELDVVRKSEVMMQVLLVCDSQIAL